MKNNKSTRVEPILKKVGSIFLQKIKQKELLTTEYSDYSLKSKLLFSIVITEAEHIVYVLEQIEEVSKNKKIKTHATIYRLVCAMLHL